MPLMLDQVTRTQILKLYATGMPQKEIAARLVLPEPLVADVLDCRI